MYVTFSLVLNGSFNNYFCVVYGLQQLEYVFVPQVVRRLHSGICSVYINMFLKLNKSMCLGPWLVWLLLRLLILLVSLTLIWSRDVAIKMYDGHLKRRYVTP